jgi:hypothetical protein
VDFLAAVAVVLEAVAGFEQLNLGGVFSCGLLVGRWSGLLLGLDWRAEEERPADQEGAEQVGTTKLAWGHEEIVAGMVRVTNPRKRKGLNAEGTKGEAPRSRRRKRFGAGCV